MIMDKNIPCKKILKPLKIGIIMPSCGTMNKWQKDCLEKLLSCDDTSVAVLLELHTSDSRRLDSNSRGWRYIFFNLYYDKICRAFRPTPHAQSGVIDNIPRLSVPSEKRKNQQDIVDSGILQQIQSYDLDIIVSLSENEPTGQIISMPRFGLWTFRFSDETRYAGNPPCFWEIYYGNKLTIASLLRLTDNPDKGIILRKGFFRTFLYSYKQNLAQCYSVCPYWPLQVCKDIVNDVYGYVDTPASLKPGQAHDLPCNIQMVIYMIRLIRNIFRKAITVLTRHEQWNIGICSEPIQHFLDPAFKPAIQWTPFTSKTKYLADPFGLEENGSITIMGEEYDYHSGKGSIITFRGNKQGFTALPQTAIKMPFHMSYPFIIQHGNEVYCLPETLENREICLYKAVNYPDKWHKACVLVADVAGVDSTVVYYDSLWWLFFTDKKMGDGLHLFIYYSDSLFGPWKPHSSNPVKTDIRSARPAGTPFTVNGTLYRPAQDCSSTYGGGITINKVVQLSPYVFREEAIKHIEPDKNHAFHYGFHTISRAGEFTLVDGKRWIFSFDEFKRYSRKILTGKW